MKKSGPSRSEIAVQGNLALAPDARGEDVIQVLAIEGMWRIYNLLNNPVPQSEIPLKIQFFSGAGLSKQKKILDALESITAPTANTVHTVVLICDDLPSEMFDLLSAQLKKVKECLGDSVGMGLLIVRKNEMAEKVWDVVDQVFEISPPSYSFEALRSKMHEFITTTAL